MSLHWQFYLKINWQKTYKDCQNSNSISAVMTTSQKLSIDNEQFLAQNWFLQYGSTIA